MRRVLYDRGILLRVTGGEHECINKLAATTGLSTSRYVVRYVVDGKAPASADEREIKRAELHELRFASNNVNQIAHHLHTSALTGCAPPSDDEIMTSLSAMHAVATARVIDRAIFIVKKRLKS